MVLLDARVGVPSATRSVVELDESHAALDQTSGHEAIAAKDAGLFFIDAVELERRVGLLSKVDRFGGLGLHPVGQLVGADAGFELRIDGSGGLMLSVQRIDQFAFGVLALWACWTRGREVPNRITVAVQRSALVGSRHEPGTPVARPVDDFSVVVFNDDESR